MTKHPAELYIEGVLSGKIVVCRFARLAVERHVRDLADGAARGLHFDREAACYSIEFFGFLRHSKGEWANQKLALEPWQQFILWCVFGWFRADGTRRYREVYEEVARKNGKTTKLAGIGLLMLAADDEPGAEVYAAATKREQARIAHSEAVRMVRSSPSLRKKIGIFNDNLHIKSTNSKFMPLGADANTMDGLNVSCAIIDELHAHKNREMCDVLETATGSRRQPLLWYITTAGTGRESVCWEKREYARKVLMGLIIDDSFFGIIYTLDLKSDWVDLQTLDEAKKAETPGVIEDQWEDEKVWIKANPNLGVSAKLDDLRRLAKKAMEIPSALDAFMQKRLNIWTSQSSRWMPMNAWDSNGTKIDLEALRGQECYAGLDLASTTDLCALALVFPNLPNYVVLPFFWIPADNMKERVQRDKVPYDVWVKQGLIYATPGNVVDYDFIIEKLKELRDTFNIRQVAYDRWGSARIMKQLQDLSFDLVPFGQGYKDMSAPSKDLLTLVLQGRFQHGGHPVLRWNADNVVIERDATDAIKPNKAKSYLRIDGIVAAIMALARATLRAGTGKSIYETRGLTTL